MKTYSKRNHPYGCRRDKENIGYLGRMSDAEYDALCAKHNTASSHLVEVQRGKRERISKEEYDNMQKEARMLNAVLAYVRGAKG